MYMYIMYCVLHVHCISMVGHWWNNGVNLFSAVHVHEEFFATYHTILHTCYTHVTRVYMYMRIVCAVTH